MTYLEFATNLAQKAGAIISQSFRTALVVERKEDNSELTKCDVEINDLVIDEVRAAFPEHSILGEERSEKGTASEYVWVCDPIDGTLPFTQGIPSAVFSLALVQNGTPIVGVIYEPILNKLYVAEQGKGAYLNGQRIHVSEKSALEKSIVEFCWTKDFKKFDPTAVLSEIYQRIGVITNHHAIIFAGSLVAEGKIDGLVFVKHTVHDGASVKIIVEEAGGKVTSLSGAQQRYDQDLDGYIASNGIIHDDLVKVGSKIIRNT